MKIVFFGLTLSSSWGNGHATPYRALLRALARAGHELTFYERDVPYYRVRRDFDACDYCRLELYESWGEVRARALAEARAADAVVLGSFVPHAERIADELLALTGPLRVFYDLDTPVTLARMAEQADDSPRPEQLGEFDLVLSFTGGEVLRILEYQYGARLARPLYGCVDPDVYTRTAPRPEFACDLSYMGTYSPDRQEKLDALLLEPARRFAGRRFVLAGSLYPYEWEWRYPQNIRRIEHVAPGEHPAFYSASRLTLNLTRASMARWGYCPSGRFFEAAACGTPIVTDWFEGLEEFFRDGEEVFVVRSWEDVAGSMERADAELARVAARARERTLAEHSGARRAQELVGYLEEAAAARGGAQKMEAVR